MSIRSRGVTLVELIVFMVIVGVAMAGLFAAFNTMTAASADPQVRKQVLAIAESLMDEVALMPFTYCDPDDPQAATATAATGTECPQRVEAIGLDAAFAPHQTSDETRYSSSARFDNVNDYHDFKMGVLHGGSGIQDIAGNTIPGLEAYSASIAVTGGAHLGMADGTILRISITVTGPGGVSITLDGYRARYAPNTTP
jgi:MSHA pilin protein MshD